MRFGSKLALGALAFVVTVAAGLAVFRVPIATALLARVAEARAGRDATAGLPDGLHVVICGSGSPLPDPTRAEACTLVIAGRRMFVVDVGDGSPRRLGQLGIPMGRISGVLLTHFHSDHIDGLGTLMLLRWTGGSATTPLPVFGPPGVEQIVAGFNQVHALDNGYRTAHHGPKVVPPSGAGAVARPFALPAAPGVVLDQDGLRITAFPVNHHPVAPAVGYRFDYKGRSVVISGDTAASPMLVRAAKGADLLVHEALQPKLMALITRALADKGLANTAQITRDILTYHSSPEQAADAARAAGVRHLLLSHLVPPLPFAYGNAAFLGEAGQHFAGPISLAHDGLMVSLPADGTAIEETDL